jgi:hypothetical protein
MTFNQHLQNAMREELQHENRRHEVREARQVLLSLEHQHALRNLIREICADGDTRHME